MDSQKKVLTTGDVARICSVAPRTVSKWFDAGQLHGYRIPGSKDRRIPLHQLVRFMRAHGIPMNGLESGCRRLLVLDDDRQFCDAIRDKLESNDRFEVTPTTSAFEAGVLANDTRPHAILVDIHRPDVEVVVLSRFLHTHADLADTCLIGTAAGLTDAEGQSLLQAGFHGYLAKPFQIDALLQLIEEQPDSTANGNGPDERNDQHFSS